MRQSPDTNHRRHRKMSRIGCSLQLLEFAGWESDGHDRRSTQIGPARLDEGADGPHGARQSPSGAHQPARHRRTGQGRRPGAVRTRFAVAEVIPTATFGSVHRRRGGVGGHRRRTDGGSTEDPARAIDARRQGPDMEQRPPKGPLTWSGRRDSNPRPQPWQGCALPAEPRPREAPTVAVGTAAQAGSSACHHGTGRSRRPASATSSARASSMAPASSATSGTRSQQAWMPTWTASR